MNALRILILCLSAAFVCVSLRGSHPQIASAVALAACVAALMLSGQELQVFSEAVRMIESYTETSANGGINMLKLCGIALISEFASDICRDAGENALAHRIDIGVKLAMLAASLPTAGELMKRMSELLT